MSSQDKRKCFTFTWTIENISYYWYTTRKVVRSPTFVINALQKSKYKLGFHPSRIMEDNWIYLFLEAQGNSSFVRIDCEFAFLSKDGSAHHSTKWKNRSRKFNGVTVSKDVFVANKLPEDKLRARCRIWKSDGEMTEDVQCFARTRICIERVSFSWNIQNFSNLHAEEKCTYQMKSMLDNEVLMTFSLLLKNPYTGEDSINIQLVSESNKIKYCVFHLMPLNGLGSASKGKRNEFSFSEDKKPKLFTLHFSKNDLIAIKDLCLPNDVLSFRCECTFSTGAISEEIESIRYGCDNFLTSEQDNQCLDKENRLSVSKRILIEDLESLLNENILSDIKLKTNAETYLAHKNILSARSPVFKAMFSDNMKEKFNECVDIEDLDSDTVHRMLQYVYTAETKDLQLDNTFKLYQAANKYEILALRDECSDYLKSNLCSKNVCKVLVLADVHQDVNLKTSVQDFIFNHDVVNSAEWKQLMKTHPKLTADTMCLQLQRKSLSM
ncbi:TD and POZ domain-containing protein 4 [Araneus ventricosus]|uniref:TD and POZ domain-containing protein 4 n=1 Tax=Araneus ventricosus TaxID=182803 RepID=A0A4Y2GAF1_ARAVE|nr:TD and POZ domain-containing protein 4 [Araneus ventricosus]